MTWLTKFNPTPAFPAYTGPYKVGTVEVEIPVSELHDPSTGAVPDLPTVAFRVFYPCKQDSSQPYARWIPSPQREYIGAYARFLGANNAISQIFSIVPQLLYYISIPAHQNAEVLEPPTKSRRWPVMVFSHGLGGSRNAYSHIVGSLASHGIVVIATEHRDGSGPASFIHDPEGKDKLQRIDYRKISHNASTEVYDARNEQLKTRLWELGLVHDALLKIDSGKSLSNVIHGKKKASTDMLGMFAELLGVHEPGSIAFAGHSFGAVTTVQFVKSVFYRSEKPQDTRSESLFTPADDSAIARQITPATPVALLDLWGLPIQSPATAWLKEKPMPCYTSPRGGSNLLAILSEAFLKWSSNLQQTKAVVAKPSKSQYPEQPGPHIFYPVSSAHLSQSDFGVLFPWVTTKIFGAKEPDRVLRLNTRAILQVLRNGGTEVADTSIADLEVSDNESIDHAPKASRPQDWRILSRTRQTVRDWVALSAEPEGDAPTIEKGPADAMVEGEVLGQVVESAETARA